MNEEEATDLGEKAALAVMTFFGVAFGFFFALPVMIMVSGFVGAIILHFTWPIVQGVFPILPDMNFFQLWCFTMTARIFFGGANVKTG